jgi:hypothetical protein
VTRISRRRLLLAGSAGIAGGLAGWALSSGFGDHILRMVGESFGPEFKDTEGARQFASDLLDRLMQDRPGQFVLEEVFYRARPIVFPELLPQERKVADLIATEFALASNVLQVIAGAERTFEYYGLYSPATSPCRNPLGAAWAV